MNSLLNLINNNWVLISGIPALLVLFLLILRQWKVGIISIFIWLYFQDSIRKLLPGQPPQIMLITDILVFITYFSFFASQILKYRKGETKLWRPPFIVGFIVFVGWCLVEAFNPLLPNVFFPLIAFRAYFWYVPLVILGYYMFREEKNLMKFCRILVYTSIPLALVAILQYFFKDSPSLLLQPLIGAHGLHSFNKGVIQLISSIFGSGDRFARQVFFLTLLGGGLSLYKYTSLKQRILIITSTIFAALGVFVSGRRAPMFLLVIAGLFFLFFLAKYLPRPKFKQILIFSIIIILFSGLLFGKFFPDTGYFFLASLTTKSIRTNVFIERFPTLFNGFRETIGNAGFLGFGTGSKSQGVNYIPGGKRWIELEGGLGGAEGGFSKIWFELGLLGALIFFLLLVSMFFSWSRELKYLRKSRLHAFGFSIFLFLLLMIPWFLKGHQIFGDTMTLVYFWFFMGVLFKLKSYLSAGPAAE